MNKDSFLDYFSCIIFKSLGALLRNVPVGVGMCFGRRLGDLFYYFDLKHRAIVYAHIHSALGDTLSSEEVTCVTKEFYRNFGQSLIEIFLIPLIDQEYLKKYIRIEGMEYVHEALARGKGVVCAGMHEGSWELYNIISANLGLPFFLFVRNQRYPRLNKLLNEYRVQKGCKIIQRRERLPQSPRKGGRMVEESQVNELYGVRKLIEALKNNEAIGMTVDQGGKSGTLVDFFGQQASMASGAIRFALKYGATILPSFLIRQKGAHHKIIVDPPFTLTTTGDFEKDVRDNLQRLIANFERHIAEHPAEYLWSYKIWKYGRQKSIVILSDGKTGHLRQSEAAAGIMRGYLQDKGATVSTRTIEVKLKNRSAQFVVPLCACLSGKYQCQSCLRCLKKFLEKDAYESLRGAHADIVISCGSSVAAVNYILSKSPGVKSIAIMRPSVFSMSRFDLVLIPRHDAPPKRKNVVRTEGALNVISQQYLKDQAEKLFQVITPALPAPRFYLGLLLGGDTKDFCLRKEQVEVIIEQIKGVAEKEDAGVLVTTSRRTSPEIERLVTEKFQGYPRCKLLVIANKNNPGFAVGGILGAAKAVIVSPESISMVSEAASSGRAIIVFRSQVSRRHRIFLRYLADKKYIYLVEPEEAGHCIDTLLGAYPQIYTLQDNLLVRNALGRIL
jgi:KDO2-lipid IV(A) lauroyltransferase